MITVTAGASCCTCTACAQLDAAPGLHMFIGSQVAFRGAVGHIVVCVLCVQADRVRQLCVCGGVAAGVWVL